MGEFKSGGGSGLLHRRARPHRPPVKGLVVFHDFVTADEERDLVRAVEPVLLGGNHISGAGRVHRHMGYGTENQGGYPCVMNRRAERVARHGVRDTHKLVPMTGPEPPAAGAAADSRTGRGRSRAVKPDLGLPAFLPTQTPRLPAATTSAGRPDRSPFRRPLELGRRPALQLLLGRDDDLRAERARRRRASIGGGTSSRCACGSRAGASSSSRATRGGSSTRLDRSPRISTTAPPAGASR